MTRNTKPPAVKQAKGDLSGQALINAMQASPDRDIDIEPRRDPIPVREVPVMTKPVSGRR